MVDPAGGSDSTIIGGKGCGVLVGTGVGSVVPPAPKIFPCKPAGRLQDKLIKPIKRINPIRIMVVFFFGEKIMGQFPFSNSLIIIRGPGR